ncbi:MAG: hypothetical protein ACRCYU_17365 [Nocardioides sp.]
MRELPVVGATALGGTRPKASVIDADRALASPRFRTQTTSERLRHGREAGLDFAEHAGPGPSADS